MRDIYGLSLRSAPDMKSGFSVLLGRFFRGKVLDIVAVLALTVSVQGIVVGGQFLFAFVAKPEELGVIRLLESAFAIALLASSCGMPSVVFREAALSAGVAGRIALIVQASILTSLVVGVVLLAGGALYAVTGWGVTGHAWAVLIAMTGVLWPANVARIAVSAAQGAQMARMIWRKLLVYSCAAVTVLFFLAQMYGINGWVIGRYTVEFGLAILTVRAMSAGSRKENGAMVSAFGGIRGLFWLGATANFAFLIRAVSDNLPILLLKAGGGVPEQLGWYGFAGLAMFVPTLLLSVLLQEKLPTLVLSIERREEFDLRLAELLRRLLWGAALSAGLMFVLSLLLYSRLIFTNYATAASAMFLLGVSLPFRAVVLTAGGAAVAHGRYAISSILAMTEIVVLLACSLAGFVDTAAKMAFAVFVSAIFSAVVATMLIGYFRRKVR